ncbi:butyrophilin-like protein 3 isoform X2 [Lissotriton helveticus]
MLGEPRMVVIRHAVVFVFALLLSSHGGESSVESPSQSIEAAVGEDVDFFCPLTNEVSAEMMEVRWVYPERCSPSVVHIYRNGRDDNLKQDPYFRGRTEILTEDIGKGIVGLRLRNISASDKGTYLCQIQSKATFVQAALQLKVSEFKDPHVSSFYSHFIEGLHPSVELKCTPKGTSFKMDNGMYWSSTPNGIRGKKIRDHTCWFQVCQRNDGNVEITDYKGNYLSLDPHDYRKSIKTVKFRNQPYSQFEVQYENEKVLFKASNGLFLSRIYYLGIEIHTIEAQKNPKDVFSLFDLVSAYA